MSNGFVREPASGFIRGAPPAPPPVSRPPEPEPPERSVAVVGKVPYETTREAFRQRIVGRTLALERESGLRVGVKDYRFDRLWSLAKRGILYYRGHEVRVPQGITVQQKRAMEREVAEGLRTGRYVGTREDVRTREIVGIPARPLGGTVKAKFTRLPEPTITPLREGVPVEAEERKPVFEPARFTPFYTPSEPVVIDPERMRVVKVIPGKRDIYEVAWEEAWTKNYERVLGMEPVPRRKEVPSPTRKFPRTPGLLELGGIQERRREIIAGEGVRVRRKELPLAFQFPVRPRVEPYKVSVLRGQVAAEERRIRKKEVVRELGVLDVGVIAPKERAVLEYPVGTELEGEFTGLGAKLVSKEKVVRKAALEKEYRALQVSGIRPTALAFPAGVGLVLGGPPGAVTGLAVGVAGEVGYDITFIETGHPELATVAGIGAGLFAGGVTAKGLSRFLSTPKAVSSRILFEAEPAGKGAYVRPYAGVTKVTLRTGKEVFVPVKKGVWFYTQTEKFALKEPLLAEKFVLAKPLERAIQTKFPGQYQFEKLLTPGVTLKAARGLAIPARVSYTSGEFLGQQFIQLGVTKPYAAVKLTGVGRWQRGLAAYMGERFPSPYAAKPVTGVPKITGYIGVEKFKSLAIPSKGFAYGAAGKLKVGGLPGITTRTDVAAQIRIKPPSFKVFGARYGAPQTTAQWAKAFTRTLQVSKPAVVSQTKGISAITARAVSKKAVAEIISPAKYHVPASALSLGVRAGRERIVTRRRDYFEAFAPAVTRPWVGIGILAPPAVVTRTRAREMEKLLPRITTVTKTRARLREAVLPRFGVSTIVRTRAKQVLLPKVGIAGRVITRTKVSPLAKFSDLLIPRTVSRVKAKQKVTTRLVYDIVGTPPPITTPPPPIPPFGKWWLAGRPPKAKKKRKPFPGFGVELKRFGKFTPISRLLPFGKALKRGKAAAEHTAAATFRLKPPTGWLPGVGVSPAVIGERFYAKRGKPLTFIEKTRYRISTPGELRQITYKGLEALRVKRLHLPRSKKRKGRKRGLLF